MKLWLPSFSYHVMESSSLEETSTSMSPSLSTSAVVTEFEPRVTVAIVWSVKFWLPSFSYQTSPSPRMLLVATTRSVSPSPSTSVSVNARALKTLATGFAEKPPAPSFSYQAISLPMPVENRSRSPSPSTSPMANGAAPSAAVVTALSMNIGVTDASNVEASLTLFTVIVKSSA